MSPSCLEDIDVVILAGGLGTRIAYKLDGMPKLLAPITGKPYLEILLKWLASFGVRRIILSLGHLAGEVKTYLSTKDFKGIQIICAVEPSPLGTAGGLAFASTYIESDTALVMNGDSFVDADLCALVEKHQTCAVEATILCTRVANAGRYNSVEIDEMGRVVSFRKKIDDCTPGRINAGVYVMSKTMIQQIQKVKKGSLETEIFQQMPLGSLNAFSGIFNFIDIGTPEAYARAPEVFEPYIKRWNSVTL